MITLRFSPEWFYGIDSLFEILALLVTFFIGLYSYKLYKFSGNRKYKLLGFSFLAITVSFFAKIVTNFLLYNSKEVVTTVSELVGSNTLHQVLLPKTIIIFHLGYDSHRFLMLIGLLGIYWLVSKSKETEHFKQMIFMLLVISIFSFNIYFAFHLMAAYILFFISRHYHRLCFNSKKPVIIHTMLNYMAFVVLFISQLIFTFMGFNKNLYVVAQILQLAGYILFLVNILSLVFGHVKKKNKN